MHHADAVSAEPPLELRDGGAAAMQQQEFGAIAVEPGARKSFFADLTGLAAQQIQLGVGVEQNFFSTLERPSTLSMRLHLGFPCELPIRPGFPIYTHVGWLD